MLFQYLCSFSICQPEFKKTSPTRRTNDPPQHSSLAPCGVIFQLRHNGYLLLLFRYRLRCKAEGITAPRLFKYWMLEVRQWHRAAPLEGCTRRVATVADLPDAEDEEDDIDYAGDGEDEQGGWSDVDGMQVVKLKTYNMDHKVDKFWNASDEIHSLNETNFRAHPASFA